MTNLIVTATVLLPRRFALPALKLLCLVLGFQPNGGIEFLNDLRRRGCHKIVPVFGGDGTKKNPPGDLFDRPSGAMSSIRGNLADHVGYHVVLSLEGIVWRPLRGKSYRIPPPPPQSLKHSIPNLS